MSNPVPEIDILKPRHPSLYKNTDEWPEFQLHNVHVHLPNDPQATTSLLEASAGYPLTVVGQLEPLDAEDAHLYSQPPTSRKRVPIVLEDVQTFSYGQYEDGSMAIWAAGKAGWFTMKPGRNYKATYDGMVQAVNLLYFVADSYREERKEKKRGATVKLPPYTPQELFEKYAAEELNSRDATEGADILYSHSLFLISSMLSEKEGIAWGRTPIYRHLQTQSPDLFAEVKQRLAGSAPGKAVKAEDVGKSSKVDSLESIKTRHKRQASVDSGSVASNLRSKRRRPPTGGTKSNTFEVIDLGDSSESTPSVAAPSQQFGVSREGDEAKTAERTRRTRQTPGSEQLIEEEPADDTVMTPKQDEDTDEETRLRARKNKSSLRPRASKSSKGTAGKSAKGPAARGDSDDELAEWSSPIRGKRKSVEANAVQRSPKRRYSKPHVDEGIDIPTSPSVSGDADSADYDTGAPLGGVSELTIRSLGHVPDPVQEDTWVCALDGCSHKIYAASHPDSQRLIREHYALHAYDDDERVRLVKKLAAPSLPAGHLMERVKLQAKIEGFPGSRQMASRYPDTVPGYNGVVQRY